MRSIRSGFQIDQKADVSTPATGWPVSPESAWTSSALVPSAFAGPARDEDEVATG